MRPVEPVVVLDDDPTGTQAMAAVPVVLSLDEATMRKVAARGSRAVHLVTNSRAATPGEARALVGGTARAARAVWPESELVLRGDSTLRGHLLEEYEAVRAASFPGEEPVLLLAPALPAAGRVTLDGVHLLERDGRRVPLHDTEYARDPAFAYSSSRLLDWAQERSAGRFAVRDGAEVHLPELRSSGSGVVRDALRRLAARGRPAVCAVDTESDDDLHHLVGGFVEARAAGVPVILRCAPAAAGVLSGATAAGPAELPPAPGPVLVVCGSYVPAATRQLAALADAYPGTLVEADVDALAGSRPEAEIDRLAGVVRERLAAGALAVLATPRTGVAGPGGLVRQRRVADGLAAVVRRLPRPLPVVVTKGGVTGAVTISGGLGAGDAWVVGPVAPGVGCWRVPGHDGSETTCLVVPGNVGSDGLLVELVDALVARVSP